MLGYKHMYNAFTGDHFWRRNLYIFWKFIGIALEKIGRKESVFAWADTGRVQLIWNPLPPAFSSDTHHFIFHSQRITIITIIIISHTSLMYISFI